MSSQRGKKIGKETDKQVVRDKWIDKLSDILTQIQGS